MAGRRGRAFGREYLAWADSQKPEAEFSAVVHLGGDRRIVDWPSINDILRGDPSLVCVAACEEDCKGIIQGRAFVLCWLPVGKLYLVRRQVLAEWITQMMELIEKARQEALDMMVGSGTHGAFLTEEGGDKGDA